ncbi:hypothetical protein H7J71_10535 [Mycolicibacterium peregrinum]|uniref:hypothetical protein n=1 Tax=Mycolicibacterium peregrinum TaxID=43304 RepID=UPI0012FF7A9C|nr:hypothetical protein [Mycolicibacterium peregrinum]MCV7202446.1 hypothetical protein [Mycolicibacterium peregrinum]
MSVGNVAEPDDAASDVEPPTDTPPKLTHCHGSRQLTNNGVLCHVSPIAGELRW